VRKEDGIRVVIAGGGTGGHLFPGIAVARELQAVVPGAHVSFVGTSRGLESRVLPREGFALDLIRSGGLKGKSTAERVRGACLLPAGMLDAWRVLTRRRPDLVIGVGGYSSGPVVLAAAARGIPTMLLEQNAVPGLTNRLLAPVVGAAAVTFESTRRFFGGKAFLSGNPVRKEFLDRVEPEAPPAPGVRVLVFGGSQGAHAINVAMMEAAPRLVEREPSLRLTHQTGERDVEAVRDAYRRRGLEADVQPFLYDMARRLRDADIVVCRAGATTLAELTAAGRPAILIPLAGATDDHQQRNAEALADAGAAEILPQQDLTGAELARRILSMSAEVDRRAHMAAAARGLARPDAARVIVERALALVHAG
jgi:UDP-N-acetylglucosamine--N-acetylmuramyl-(pentapeptide) pyrophosphoryl-undecaprenol N-acetylglucosamine transferase